MARIDRCHEQDKLCSLLLVEDKNAKDFLSGSKARHCWSVKAVTSLFLILISELDIIFINT